jgi:hypothetical protein
MNKSQLKGNGMKISVEYIENLLLIMLLKTEL